MRQGQQNRRGRGRNNSNGNHQHQGGRKGQNPLTRSFESNGPDVKIRGTPAHVAEKYMALARDALTSGDPVLAENYLQHAEHYNRIILAFREQQIAQGGAEYASGQGGSRPATLSGSGDEFGDEEGDEFTSDGMPQPMARGQEPQPRSFEGQRFEERQSRPQDQQNQNRQHNNYRDRDRQGGGERRFQNDRGERFDRQDRHDRGERFDRQDQRGERQDRPERTEPRVERAERAEPDRAPATEAAPRPRERAVQPHEQQPEFLRRPVRRPRRESEESVPAAAPAPVPAGEDRD